MDNLILGVGTVSTGAPLLHTAVASGLSKTIPRLIGYPVSERIQCQLISYNGQDLSTRLPAVGCTVALGECANHGFVD